MASAQLTPLLVSPSDLRRARRELELLDDFLHQASLRQGGKAIKMPAQSKVLEALAADSDLNLLKKTDRDRLLKFIVLLTQKAPVLHMSFASEPSLNFLNKLVAWLRTNIHPQVVISVGLQPTIAAGCIIRTQNKQFDFSLREKLNQQTTVFIQNLRQDFDDTTGPQVNTPQPIEEVKDQAPQEVAK